MNLVDTNLILRYLLNFAAAPALSFAARFCFILLRMARILASVSVTFSGSAQRASTMAGPIYVWISPG